jgi:RHS repeat-associated protein
VIIKEPGYAYIYLSNEGAVQQDIYFDDVTITHKKSPIVQGQEYYPFGLTFNSYLKESTPRNDWKFQGQEHEDGLDLNWDQFKWRNHQPDIGRFFNVDPLSDKYVHNSPYAFSENKVTAHVELEGLEARPYYVQKALSEGEALWNKITYEVGKAVDNVAETANKIANFTDYLPKEEEGGQQVGTGINIYSDKAGPDNKYVPAPDADAANFDLEKSVLDAAMMGTKSLTAPSADDIGESAKNIAIGIDKATKAGNIAKGMTEKDNEIRVYGNPSPAGTKFQGETKLNDSTKVVRSWESEGGGRYIRKKVDTVRNENRQ